MNRHLDEDIPYRSPLTGIATTRDAVPVLDEQNFSSLRAVQATLHEGLEGLFRDFNAFSLVKDANNATAKQAVLRQIEARQLAYEFLAPIVQSVDSAIETVNNKYREE